MAQLNLIVMSVPTSGDGATAAATFVFGTADYKPPKQGRSNSVDTVHNQNGLFRHVYDNGPNFSTWDPFRIACRDELRDLGSATQQLANLRFLWNYIGPIGLGAPDGSYSVIWAPNATFEPDFRAFPASVGDKIEMSVVINIEEG